MEDLKSGTPTSKLDIPSKLIKITLIPYLSALTEDTLPPEEKTKN